MIGLNPICLIAINMYISINGYESGLAGLNCGVPQGSVLGPLLFLLYINDLNQAIKIFKVHHFADDTNLFFFNWDSLHARLNSHYEAWSYKKKKSTKKITGYRKSVQKEHTVKRCLLIPALKPLRS